MTDPWWPKKEKGRKQWLNCSEGKKEVVLGLEAQEILLVFSLSSIFWPHAFNNRHWTSVFSLQNPGVQRQQ